MHGHILEMFAHHLRQEQLGERTIRIYVYMARSYMDALAIGGMKLVHATRDTVGRYLEFQKGRGCGSGSLRNHQAVIRRLHEFAGEPSPNPLAKPFRFRRVAQIPRALPEGSVVKLLESVNATDPISLRDRAILELLYSTGIRASEAIGITLDDLDLSRRVARIMGKGSREALVTIGEPARAGVGCPLVVHDGWRPAAENARVRGAKASDHLEGRAADMHAAGSTTETWESATLRLFDWIRLHLQGRFGQLILEDHREFYCAKGDPKWAGKLWVHVAIPSPKHPGTGNDRNAVLVSPAPEVYRVFEEPHA